MHTIYRYKAPKPTDGHVSWLLHTDATILSFTEKWHSEHGWELSIDALEDTSKPKERRWFFLCNGGDDLTFIDPDNVDLYYIGTHSSKSYCSYLFETTHLSETEREQGHVQPARYKRNRPDWDDLSRTEREIVRRQQTEDRKKRVDERATAATVAGPVEAEGMNGAVPGGDDATS